MYVCVCVCMYVCTVNIRYLMQRYEVKHLHIYIIQPQNILQMKTLTQLFYLKCGIYQKTFVSVSPTLHLLTPTRAPVLFLYRGPKVLAEKILKTVIAVITFNRNTSQMRLKTQIKRSTTSFPQRSLLSFCRNAVLCLRNQKFSRNKTSRVFSL